MHAVKGNRGKGSLPTRGEGWGGVGLSRGGQRGTGAHKRPRHSRAGDLCGDDGRIAGMTPLYPPMNGERGMGERGEIPASGPFRRNDRGGAGILRTNLKLSTLARFSHSQSERKRPRSSPCYDMCASHEHPRARHYVCDLLTNGLRVSVGSAHKQGSFLRITDQYRTRS